MGKGIVNVDVGSLASGIMEGLDHLFTSDEERLAAEFKVRELVQRGLDAQAEINKVEAAHPSVFVSGWRPFIGWMCGAGLAFQWVLRPLMVWVMDVSALLANIPPIPHPPSLDVKDIISLVTAMLGIALYRSYEKTKGVARIS